MATILEILDRTHAASVRRARDRLLAAFGDELAGARLKAERDKLFGKDQREKGDATRQGDAT